MSDNHAAAAANEKLDSAQSLNPYTTELPGAEELDHERKQFLKQFHDHLQDPKDVDDACQRIIDKVYGLLTQYAKLGFLLSSELDANEEHAHSELYKLTVRKFCYNEESLKTARTLARSMDLQLNEIEEVDSAGNPLHPVPKLSDLAFKSSFNHTRPSIGEFLLCIKNAPISYRSKYIAGDSFVQPAIEFRAIEQTKSGAVLDDSNASNDIFVKLS